MNRTFKVIDPKSTSREIQLFTDTGENIPEKLLDVDYKSRFIKSYTFFFNSAAAKSPRAYSERHIYIERITADKTDHREEYKTGNNNPAAAKQLYKELIKDILQPIKIIEHDRRHIIATPDRSGEIVNNDYFFYTIIPEA